MATSRWTGWAASAAKRMKAESDCTTARNDSTSWAATDKALVIVAGLALAFITLLSPEMAMAQTAVDTLDPIEQILESIIGIMTGPIATGVAIIGVASIGYMWMTGRMEMTRALTIIIGMVIIFGAANIVNALRGSTGFTGAGTIGG